MKKYKNRNLREKIKLRLNLSWAALIFMIVYMVVIGEMGLGDSRIMTPLAVHVSRVIYFGGLIYIISRIIHNRKLLSDKLLLQQQKPAADERAQFLHDKSGGYVMDILLLLLLSVTCTTALWNMPAFYVSLGILISAILLKLGSYYLCNGIY